MKNQQGSLFLIGGGSDSIFSDFVKLAGGAGAHIAVVTHATAYYRQAFDSTAAALRSLGVTRITPLTPRTPPVLPADVTAIYMSGGDQSRLVRLTDKNGLAEQIRDALRRGVLVAGTSAGMAGAAHVMIADGMSDRVLRRNSLVLGKGLCLICGVVFDTHFGQRNRQNRARAAVATVSGACCLGNDEDTAVHIIGRRCRVYGPGEAWLYQAPELTKLTAGQVVSWEYIAENATCQRFKSGQEFDLP
jgi:cyanophycinase